MKKLITLLASSLLAVFAFVPHTVVAEGEIKIGTVDAFRILEQSPQAVVAKKKIEKEFAPRDRKLDAKQKKLKEMEDKLNKDRAIMGEAEVKKLERDIVAERRELRREPEEFREDFNFRRNEELAKIQKDIVDTIKEVAKANGYDIILGEGFFYTSKRVDLTNKVIEKLKSKELKSKE